MGTSKDITLIKYTNGSNIIKANTKTASSVKPCEKRANGVFNILIVRDWPWDSKDKKGKLFAITSIINADNANEIL